MRTATKDDRALYKDALNKFEKTFQGPLYLVPSKNAVCFFAYGSIRELSVHSYSGSVPALPLPRISIQTGDVSRSKCEKLGIEYKKTLHNNSVWQVELTVAVEELSDFIEWLAKWLSSPNEQSPALPHQVKGDDIWPMTLGDRFHFYEWSHLADIQMQQIQKWRT